MTRADTGRAQPVQRQMMILDLKAARQNRPGRNANRTRLEFKDAIAGATAKMMVMPTVRWFKVRFLAGQQNLNDRSSLAQQTYRAVDGRQAQSWHARTASLEDGCDIQWAFSRLDDLENRLALPGVALCWGAGRWLGGVHGLRISLAK
jgi:hypothetical protein